MPAILFSLATILLWGFLAVLSAGVSHLPAFLSAGLALTLGGLVGLELAQVGWVAAQGSLARTSQPR